MAANGILKGTGNNNFEPSKILTRVEFVTMLVTIMKLNYSNKASPFTDINHDDWFKPNPLLLSIRYYI